MKKTLIALMLVVAAHMTLIAQNESVVFKKNEIGFSTMHLGYNLNIFQGDQFNLNGYSKTSLYYRHFIKDDLALRLDGTLGLIGGNGQTNFTWSSGIGFEKYYKITDKLYWYTGAKLYSTYRPMTEFIDHSNYGLGVDLLGGLRYQLTTNVSVGTEWVIPMRYHWSPELNTGAFNTGIYNNAIKIGITF
jgi:opacity protein-like surface antigen